MKTLAVLLAVVALARVGWADATNATNQITLQQPRPAQPVPRSAASDKFVIAHGTNSNEQFLRKEWTYSGVLPDLRRKKGEFFKPPTPGTRPEFHNVSIDPLTGRADGIILFSIGF